MTTYPCFKALIASADASSDMMGLGRRSGTAENNTRTGALYTSIRLAEFGPSIIYPTRLMHCSLPWVVIWMWEVEAIGHHAFSRSD